MKNHYRTEGDNNGQDDFSAKSEMDHVGFVWKLGDLYIFSHYNQSRKQHNVTNITSNGLFWDALILTVIHLLFENLQITVELHRTVLSVYKNGEFHPNIEMT